MSALTSTIKSSAIYAIGTILRRITGLVMLPIYTQYLTPSDYGVVELLGMAIELTGILIGLRISQALFRYYILAQDDEEKRIIVSTIFLTILGTTTVGVILLQFFAPPLVTFIFGGTEHLYEFKLFSYTLIFNAVSAVGLAFIRARRKPYLYISVGIITLILQVSFNVLFLVYYEMHIIGVVYSALISGAVVSMGLSVYLVVQAGIGYSRVFLVRLVRFMSPLILAGLGAFYVGYADKYFIRLFAGLAEVGLYSLAMKMAGLMGAVFEAFNMTWGAERFEVYKRDNAKQIFGQVFRMVGSLFILIATGIAMFSSDLFRVMTSPEFHRAGDIVPILTLAALFKYGMIYTNFGLIVNERTGPQASGAWLKAVVATIGYVLLIPDYGSIGAACVVAFATLVQYRWNYVHATREYNMELQWLPIFVMLALACMTVGAGMMMPYGEVLYFIIRVLMYLGLLICFYLLPFWTDEERRSIRNFIVRVWVKVVRRSREC